MPRLWTATIDAHREAVREAILEAAAAEVKERGLTAVTMSQVAQRAQIGRATLYKYFADVEAILTDWHRRHVGNHLERLSAIAGGTGPAVERLRSVLTAYAEIVRKRGRHGAELVAFLHRGEHVQEAEQQLVELVHGLVAEMVEAGVARRDVPSKELAHYCISAIGAAVDLPSQRATQGLVRVVLAGLSR